MKDKLISLSKLFDKLYEQGLIGIGDNYLLVEKSLFKQLCDRDRVIVDASKTSIELKSYISNEDGEAMIITLL